MSESVSLRRGRGRRDSVEHADTYGHPDRRKRVRKLGRRPGDKVTRDHILNVAEEAFAAGGYAGTSIREIADRADVNTALVQYYFSSREGLFGAKEGLFEAIFLRRGRELSRERLKLLDALEKRPGKPPTVEELVRAFLTPAFDLKRRGAGGIAFMRLQARLTNESSEITQQMREMAYEESVQRYVVAIRKALPKLERNAVFWRMAFMIGAYFYIVSDLSRLETMSGGKCSSKDLDEAFRQLVSFFVGGFRAPMID